MKMKKHLIVALAFGLCVLSFGSGMVKADPAGDMADAKALKNLDDSEQNRRIDELERSLGNLERQIDRLDDQIEKMDHSVKELKRKI